MTNRRILIVDDMSAIHDDFRKILGSATPAGGELDALEAALFGAVTGEAPPIESFELDSALQGPEALALVEASLAQDRPYALAFVDMRMPPGWDGVRTVEELWRADPRLQVVICTAYSDSSHSELLRRLDVADRLLVLRKPFDPVEVLQLANALTAKWEHGRESLDRTTELEQLVGERTAELTRANEELRLAASVFEYALDGIVITDSTGVILSANPSFVRMTGFGLDEVVGQPHRILRNGPEVPGQDRVMGETVMRQGRWSGELWHRRKDGEPFLARVSLSRVGTDDGEHRFVAILSDITELRRKDERIEHLAFHDHLTELPNRTLLADRLEDRIEASRAAAEPLGVLFVDLDRFKAVNDSYGHDVGNELLKLLAVRLKQCLRDSDTVARVGGDEFVVLLARSSEPEDYAGVAQRIISELSEPALVDGHLLQVGATVGIACFPEDGDSAADLIKNADAAMYSAKSAGRGRFAFFETEMTAKARRRLDLEMALRGAADNGELELFYQPKLALGTGDLIGVEALVRWRHPDRGMIPPLEFIPMAEETGVIGSLGRWVLHEACRQSVAWRSSLRRRIPIAINTSAVQLRTTDLVAELLRACDEYGTQPEDLEVELTESAVMSNLAEVAPMFSRLREIGVPVSVDDFGTGYSSLAYLRTLPIDVMKIDRSFIRNMDTSGADREIVKVLIALAKALELTLVAEGVETSLQAELLLDYGCDTGQGYLFSPPLPAGEFERWLLTRAEQSIQPLL